MTDRSLWVLGALTSKRSCFLFGGIFPSVLTAFGPRRRFYDRPVVVGSGGSYLPAKLLSLGRYSPTCVNRFRLSPMVKKPAHCCGFWGCHLILSLCSKYIPYISWRPMLATFLTLITFCTGRGPKACVQGSCWSFFCWWEPQGVCTGLLLVVFSLVGAPGCMYSTPKFLGAYYSKCFSYNPPACFVLVLTRPIRC